MKLTYSILWFDDDEDYIDSVDLEPIKEAIESWGFTPNIVMVSQPEDFMRHEPFKEFDLIAVDYNLEACGEHGENFIQNLRQHGIYTEVVFYSANESSYLWNAVRKKELEGVFIASRAGGGEQTKIINVAKQSVHKFLDLNNIRGVIMAEVGNIDDQLDMIARKSFDALKDEKQIELINKYVLRVTEQNNKNSEKIALLQNTTNIDSLLANLDSTKKWNICKSLSNQIEGLNIQATGDYQAEVLKPRNFMAHGIPAPQEDGSLLFKHFEQEYIFSDEKSIELRQKLQHYSNQFDEILRS
jgi:DNA-binding NtrC family response regulator